MAKYFWADTHFGHSKVIEYSKRKFKDVEEMNETLILAWNSAVGDRDDIYFLGDFSFEKDPTVTFSRLKGNKHLILGNHDKGRRVVLGLGWKSINDVLLVKENGVRAVCCHFPMETWEAAHYGYLMLHGHSHGKLKRVIPHRFDVGVDVFPAPVSLSYLGLIAQNQSFNVADHLSE